MTMQFGTSRGVLGCKVLANRRGIPLSRLIENKPEGLFKLRYIGDREEICVETPTGQVYVYSQAEKIGWNLLEEGV